MPYPAGHSKLVRKKIIDSARKLFNRYGFDNVSIKQIMAYAGLTHGGFYSYFESKGDLYSAFIERCANDDVGVLVGLVANAGSSFVDLE